MRQIISFIALIIFIFPIHAQQNTLLDRSFWNETTSINQIGEAIKKGADPLEFNASGFNPTTLAILASAPLSSVSFLLDMDGNPINQVTHDSRNYLMWAGMKGNYELIELLIKRGGDVSIIDSKGNNLQTYTAMGGTTDKRIYELYKKEGLKLDAPNRNGGTVVHYLAQHIKTLDELDYFKKEGIDLNALDENGSSLVHYAASQGNIKLIEQLLEIGFDVKAENKDKESALFFAARGKRSFINDAEILKFLMDKGLDLTATNRTANNLLHYIALFNKNKDVYELLLNSDVDVQLVNREGNNPLLIAASRNNEVALSMLFPLTKNKVQVNKEGYSLLTYAIRNKNESLIKVLLSISNDYKNFKQLDAEGNNLIFHLVSTYTEKQQNFFNRNFEFLLEQGIAIQESSIHSATLQENTYLIKQLVKSGGSINALNKEGLSPLQQAAIRSTRIAFLKELIDLGADQTVLTEFDETIYELAQENELLQGNLEFLK